MHALVYFPSIPRYLAARALGKRYPASAVPLRLVPWPYEGPPAGFVEARVRLAGLCGSDLALLFGKNSPRLAPFFSFPAILGHEILAEYGGTRVAVNPLLTCADRGLPPCPACQRGEEPLCLNVAEGALAPGMIGYHRDLPGGFGPFVFARPERLYPIPDAVPDARAVLAEPLAVVMRGLRKAFYRDRWNWPEDILIIGAGTIGLLSLAALRALGFDGTLAVLARRKSQQRLAERLGASRVFARAEDALRFSGAKAYRPPLGPPVWRGGFAATIDAAGTPSSLDTAAWGTREGGQILLLGAAGETRHDFSPHWFAEVALVGSYTYAPADFKDAVSLLTALEGTEALVGPPFRLTAWRDALDVARKKTFAKVVFAPKEDTAVRVAVPAAVPAP